MELRKASKADYPALGQVMFDAIHGPGSPYSEAERHAWLSAPNKGVGWDARLDAQWCVMAEDTDDVLGFMTLAAEGYVDFAYIVPRAQGRGAFRALYTAIEQEARHQRLNRIWVHASLRAEPAFRAMGFAVTKRETVVRDGQSLRRAEMEKKLEQT